jgi:hypothetical protein
MELIEDHTSGIAKRVARKQGGNMTGGNAGKKKSQRQQEYLTDPWMLWEWIIDTGTSGRRPVLHIGR